MAPNEEARRARDEALTKYQAELDRLAAAEQVAVNLRDLRVRNHFADQIITAMRGPKQ